jgi:hypothetical protein
MQRRPRAIIDPNIVDGYAIAYRFYRFSMDATGERLYPSLRFLQRGCSSVDRVLASEAKGRWFDPSQPRHFPPDLFFV